jgi:DNA-binding winged helix-turn-helix (wHTH) protein
MEVERGIGRHRIGSWEFSPASGELRRRTDVRRLEPRASRALALLCEADGDIVSQEQLIAKVWGGRALSDNSVAVVIGQLRKALEDDAREPRLIETIPKRGYRLRKDQASASRPVIKRGLWIAAGVLLLLASITVVLGSRGAPLTIAVADVRNLTGDPNLAPLARATSELIVAELGERGFAVRRGREGDLLLETKLVMWDGLPYRGMTASDRDRVVRWSAMIKATPGAVPPALEGKADELAARFPADAQLARLANPAPPR